MKVSFVIPMYNAGPFIEKCIRSCMAQGMDPEDYEIIVINDGSTDEGPAIVEDLMRECEPSHIRLRLYSQRNSGLAASRNKGISLAAGDRIWFVDADDSIKENCLASMLEEVGDSDLLAFGMTNLTSDGSVESVFKYDMAGRMTGRDFLVKFNERLKLCVPLFLFKRTFLVDNDLRFEESVMHEDTEFTPRMVYRARSIAVSEKVPYDRLIHPGSITQTVNPRRVQDLVTILKRLKEFRDSEIEEETCKKAFNSILSNVANNATKLSEQTGQADREAFKTAISECSWLPSVLRGSMQWKYRLEGMLLTLFPGNYPGVHRFLLKFK